MGNVDIVQCHARVSIVEAMRTWLSSAGPCAFIGSKTVRFLHVPNMPSSGINLGVSNA